MQATLKEEGYDNDAALESAIKKLETDLKKARKKDVDGEDGEVSFCVEIRADGLYFSGRGTVVPSY